MLGGKGGDNGWGSASGSILAASAGLGASAAVPRLLIRLLPDPGSRGKVLKILPRPLQVSSKSQRDQTSPGVVKKGGIM